MLILMVKGIYEISYLRIGEHVPLIIMKGNDFLDKKLPAVIVMHGLFGNKERNLAFAMMLANKGFLIAMPDAYMHGDRMTESLIAMLRDDPLRSMFDILTRTTEDIINLIDYLEMRGDVDNERIGMTGISMGGILTFLVGIQDNRLKALAPIIASGDFLTIFKKSAILDELGVDKGEVAKIRIPDNITELVSNLDPAYHPESLYPRPILMVNGSEDIIIPKDAVQLTVSAIKKAYEQKPELFKFSEHQGVGHTVTPKMLDEVVKFFEETLAAKNE